MVGKVKFQDVSHEPCVAFIAKNCLEFAPTMKSVESKCMLPAAYAKHAERIRNLEVRPDDVWVLTYPKCGPTWVQEMVWLLANDLDFKTAKEVLLEDRFTFLEFGALDNTGILDDTIEIVEQSSSPRFIKTHLCPDTLPQQLFTVKPKIIYVARNPKDVALSMENHYRIFLGYSGTQEDFINAFLDDMVLCGPVWSHFIYFWEKRKELNLLFLTYEEMKEDLGSVIESVADYLGTKVPKDSKSELVKHLSFESMKSNPMVNFESLLKKLNYPNQENPRFMREGRSGSWINVLSEEVASRFDQKSKDALKKTDFPYYRETLSTVIQMKQLCC